MDGSLTKIVCTIGPETSSKERIMSLVDAGMSIARLNFSHGTREEHLGVIRTIKECRDRAGRYVAIALDTKGPEVRVGTPDGKDLDVKDGDFLGFSTNPREGDVRIPRISFESLCVGREVFIDDGAIKLKIAGVRADGIECKVLAGGAIADNKSMNFPGMDVGLGPLGDEDRDDIVFGIENGIDMVFVSFVAQGSDVEEVRRLVGGSIPVISKIESCLGLRNVKEVVSASDGVMIARGDLGVEIGLERMFSAQKRIVWEALGDGKPVICATQMMESMTLRSAPSRSEVSDVGNAVLDRCDCVMLSGETAVGMFPVETVRFMRRICLDAEEYSRCCERKGIHRMFPYICAIAVISGSDSQLEQIYSTSPEVPVIAVTDDRRVLRKFSVYRGIVPVEAKGSADVGDALKGLGIRGRVLVVCGEDMKTVDVLEV